MPDDRRDILADQHSPRDPQAGTAGTQSPRKFAHHIQGVEWPATKEQLLEKARSSAAPDEILRGLTRLPGRRFESMDEVLTAYEQVWPDRGTGHGGP